MADYIDRDAVYHAISVDCGLNAYEKAYCIDIVRKIPAADVAPVRHGQWEWFEEWYPSTPDHPRECQDSGWRCGKCKTALEDVVGGCWNDPDEEPKVTRHSILATADSTVNGARAEVYGGPEDSFKLIASFLEPYIAAKCVGGDVNVCIKPEDVAVLMSLMKVARLAASPNHEDSWVDMAGYAACGAELACRGGAV